MTLTRNVNGVDIVMSPEDEAQVLAEWAANTPPVSAAQGPTLQDVINVLSPDQQAAITGAVQSRSSGLT